MGNRHRGDTPTEVDGESYTLCFDLNACAEVMDHLGVHSFEAMGDLNLVNVGLKDVRFILWAGLQRHHPDMTERDVGGMGWDLQEVLPHIGEAFNRGLVREVPAQAAEGSTSSEVGAEGNARRRKKTGAGKKRNG